MLSYILISFSIRIQALKEISVDSNLNWEFLKIPGFRDPNAAMIAPIVKNPRRFLRNASETLNIVLVDQFFATIRFESYF